MGETKDITKKIVAKTEEDICATLAIKCYKEQLVNGEDGLINAINSISGEYMQVLAIKHYKSKKEHWHILVRFSERNTRKQVASILSMLGIQYRPGKDDKIKSNHGLETIGSISVYATYLLHDTVDAKRAGKEPYDKSEYLTNISDEELQHILDGYVRRKKNIERSEVDICLQTAKKAGYNLEPFESFVDSLQIKKISRELNSELKKAHKAGVDERVLDNKVCRVKISIQHDGDVAKAYYAVKKALAKKRYVIAETGDMIMVNPYTEAVVAKKIHMIHSEYDWMRSNEIKVLTYKRVWAGKLLIVITDSNFEYYGTEYGRPAKTIFDGSFFYSKIEGDNLVIQEPMKDISIYKNDELLEMKTTYINFRDGFEKGLKEYNEINSGVRVDFSDL